MYHHPEANMSVKGLICKFNMPKMVLNESGKVAGLPPYAPQKAYLVDEYPGCPENWMRSDAHSQSYFVVIQENHGMWLDFTANEKKDNEVAVRLSIQGIDPITGMKTEHFHLEQYRETCPLHGIVLGAGRYCPRCGYKWPPQNYLATTAGGKLWIDGFRTQEGVVRQYYFTSEEKRGVAAQLIGDQRVFCIGVAFYLSKEKKPRLDYYDRIFRNGGMLYSKGSFNDELLGSTVTRGGHSFRYESRSMKSLEIGAGDEIKQEISRDPKPIDYWQPEPDGFIYINYVTQEQASAIFAQGKLDMTRGGEGPFAGLKTGNPFGITAK